MIHSSIRSSAASDEAQRLLALHKSIALEAEQEQRIENRARNWIEHIQSASGNLFAGMLTQFGLDSAEGQALLSLAECFLRIPDEETALEFSRSMLSQGRWKDDFFASATWTQWVAESALKWGKFYFRQSERNAPWLLPWTNLLFLKTVRLVIQRAAQHFIFAENIHGALSQRHASLLYSFDMLGESALGNEDVERYLNAYGEALLAMAEQPRSMRDSLSIKLSALHPQFAAAKQSVCLDELTERCLWLAKTAALHNIELTLDAEDSETLGLTMNVMRQLRRHPDLASWDGLGIAVQAYLPNAPETLSGLEQLARQTGLCIPVRLVKGAYWDAEIKRAQQLSLTAYPVYCRKQHTDIAYLACARFLLQSRLLRPQFATHNAHTLAWIQEVAGERPYEVQRLQGMGEALHQLHQAETGYPCRLYAPIGAYAELLPYLVRRLLENSSNQSFVAQLSTQQSVEPLANPFAGFSERLQTLSAAEADPRHLPGVQWHRASGFSLADEAALLKIQGHLHNPHWPEHTGSIINGQRQTGALHPQHSRADGRFMTQLHLADAPMALKALQQAQSALSDWQQKPLAVRANCLLRMAAILEEQATDYLCLLVHEGGKVLMDAQAELREAVELCRYYAMLAQQALAPQTLAHITGEANTLLWQGRGMFVCLSPWNFPLAIFLGQIAAALVCGNTVVAKPALQTPMLAERAVRDLHHSGIPVEALQLLLGTSAELGQTLLEFASLAGVALTGSTQTAQQIHQQLAEKHTAVLPLIAETGGLNTLIADSTALIPQLVRDVLVSAFNSAGQRCSSCRILFVQDTLLDSLRAHLSQAMSVLLVGNPLDFATDVGPVIDLHAQSQLLAYQQALGERSELLAQADIPEHGCYVAPAAYLCSWNELPDREIFGPILHVACYACGEEAQVLQWIRHSGYGLTLGIYSRMPASWLEQAKTLGIGNVYVNRNQIGAQVGCQPFGGQGLSGTGFKAGGPHYLFRFSAEQVICNNLTAQGINTELATRPVETGPISP